MQNFTTAAVSSIPKRFARSLVGKIVIIGFIILILMIPYFMAVGLRRERMNRAELAEREVSEKWGGSQLVTAPVLAIPVQHSVTKNDRKSVEQSTWYVLPEKLSVESRITPEIRYRGIYPVMLYRSAIKIKADFSALRLPAPGDWSVIPGGKRELLFCLSDVKGIQKLEARVQNKAVKPLAGNILSFPLSAEQGNAGFQFTADLDLNGCRDLQFLPIGQTFELTMDSVWPHPSFSGGFLPATRTVSEKGFHAGWIISELNSSFPQGWVGTLDRLPWKRNQNPRSLGVSLVQPAGVYQQVGRVSDYAFLLIAIVLVAFLIGENITKIWIHPLQYFFAGLSLVMFYVLLLALAEHVSFNLSYALTTLVITGMTTMYCRMIFERKKSAAFLLGGVMFLAYLLIFFLIRLEDYALLAGSGVLLVLLGILMRVTGNMNREEISAESAPEKAE